MATNPKMKPCPNCGSTADLSVYGGWVCESLRHVECVKCNYLGPSARSVRQAIKLYNADVAALSAGKQGSEK